MSNEISNIKKHKRDHGDGNISMRKDGTWTSRIQIGTNDNGKPRIKAFYGKSEAEVKRKLKDFKKDINNLPSKEIQNLSLETYILNWLFTYKRNELKSSSFDRLESIIKNHIIPDIGFLQMITIKGSDIQGFINDMKNKGLSYSSIKKAYDALNACFEHAVIHDVIIKNPCLGVSMPSQNQFEAKEIIFFSEEQVKKINEELIRTYKNGKFIYYNHEAFIIILNTGLRVGEIAALKWTDVDLKKKTIHICKTLITVKKRDEETFETTSGYDVREQDSVKTFSGNRVIDLNNRAYAAMLALKSRNGQYEYILANQRGNLTPPHNIERTFYRILDNIGIERSGVHSLRHTFASTLFAKGIDVKTVSEILGHSNTSITYNTYIHLIKEQKRQAVLMIDDI